MAACVFEGFSLPLCLLWYKLVLELLQISLHLNVIVMHILSHLQNFI